MLVLVSVFDFSAGGFTTVVFDSLVVSFLSVPAPGVTTVFSSQAARSAAPAKMHRNFFILNVLPRQRDKADSDERGRPALRNLIARQKCGAKTALRI